MCTGVKYSLSVSLLVAFRLVLHFPVRSFTVRQGREWRIRYNEEIDNTVRKKDIVRFVKARRISWIGHVERMEDKK
jgi:hypothetical protein